MTTALNKLQTEISTLTTKSGALLKQINEAQRVAGKSAQSVSDVDALRQQRHRLLAQIHLGRADDSLLTVLDAQLLEAESHERKANQTRQGAEGAALLLTEENAAIQEQLAGLLTQLPGALYRAHCKHASEAIGPFRAALEQLAKAHAVLQGRLLAVDKFADPRQGRVFIAGGLVSSFASTLPAIPGYMEREDVTFNMTADIENEFAASLSSLGGAGSAEEAQRRRIEAAANEADRAMRAAMAAVGAS